MTKSVLVAIDLHHQEDETSVIEQGLALARVNEAELHLIYVIPDQQVSYVQQYVPSDMRQKVNDAARADLEKFASGLVVKDLQMHTHLKRGIVYEEIIKLSDEIKADYIVIGAHKPNFMDFFMGPNAGRVARYSKSTVMIVRPPRNS